MKARTFLWKRRLGLGAVVLASGAVVAGIAVTVVMLTRPEAVTQHAEHLGLPAETGIDETTAGPLSDETVLVERDRFNWSGQLDGYTDQKAFFPQFSGSRALVRIEGSITSGDFNVNLMDGAAVFVLDRWIRQLEGSSLVLTSDSGSAGVWMVTLTFRNANGDLRVTVEPLGS